MLLAGDPKVMRGGMVVFLDVNSLGEPKIAAVRRVITFNQRSWRCEYKMKAF
jgi:hypothetical protein